MRRVALALALVARVAAAQEAPSYSTEVIGEPADPLDAPADAEPQSEVQRADLERRLPRSAPDALRYEPGVFVQQSAHGQGSAFIRGLTGQQTVIVFDGIRLNNSTYRQGPNQYFFTLDSRTVDSLEVQRGGASTRWGSDALGGVVLARPIEPRAGHSLRVRPAAQARAASADGELGGRLQVEATGPHGVRFLGGVGGRRVGLLESGGPVLSPADGSPALVPRFDEDGRTQLGTGFDEVTADARLVYEPAHGHRLTAAAYTYRQLDAPRTDLCPPAYARWDECLTYEEQFRTLVYAAWSGRLGKAARAARVTLSWQQQHERRNASRPASYVSLIGRDDVDTIGLTAAARTAGRVVSPWVLRLAYGADTYQDLVRSRAWQTFTDTGVTSERSRGQYLEGSRYLNGGVFADASARMPGIVLTAGGRFSWIAASAPADPESGTAAIDRAWFPVVGHGGIAYRAWPGVTLLVNADRSFRAPNLDDLTSRQQTGPGFQFENPDLEPEAATTLEAGARLRAGRLAADAWLFQTWIEHAVGKLQREATDCPPDTPACTSSWSRFQLANARSAALVQGVEASARLRLPWRVTARATFAWTFGEGPNLIEPPSDPSLPYEERVPLSRIPPMNGTVEALWSHHAGFGASAGLRWALTQDRLAVADRSDARIPTGGTPGFAVLDVRGSYRRDRLVVALAIENLFDAAYRTHGSSVNGPGRGIVLWTEFSL